MSEIWLYIIVGIFAGTLSGLLGVGGGVIVVPCFIWIFESIAIDHSIIMHLAAGTSLAAMIVTTAVTVFAHHRRGIKVQYIIFILMPGLMVGTMVGAVLAHFIHSHVLRILFGLLLLGVSLDEFFHAHDSATPGKPFKTPGMMGGSFLIGTLSGLLGIGGGAFTIPFLEKCQISIRNAVAISAACGLIVAITGTITMIVTGMDQPGLPHDATGYVYWPAMLGVSIGSPVFSYLGANLSHHMSTVLLRRIFSVFLLFVALKLIIGN